MKHKITAVLLLLLILTPTVLFAQGGSEISNIETESITAVDSLGRLVSLDGYPERIIAAGKATLIVSDALYLFPESRDKVVGLGLTNQGLGDFYSYLAPQFPKTERFAHSVGAEEIASKTPDLVIIKSRNYESLGKQLELLDIPVFTMNLENPETFTDELHQLSILLGEESRGMDLIDYYADAFSETVSMSAKTDKEDVLLLYCAAKDGITAFQTAPKNWIQTYIVENAGANAVWKDSHSSNGWQKVSFEQIAAWDPDRIYLISYKVPTARFIEQIESSDAWEELSAVKNGQVKAFPADFHNWAQPDTRWILGLRWLAQDLNGGSDDFTAEVSSFYEELYGIVDESAMEDILSRYEDSL